MTRLVPTDHSTCPLYDGAKTMAAEYLDEAIKMTGPAAVAVIVEGMMAAGAEMLVTALGPELAYATLQRHADALAARVIHDLPDPFEPRI